MFWSYYISHSIYYLKLDMSAIFDMTCTVWLFVRDTVMYNRKYHILCKILLINNLLFLEITYQYNTKAFRKKNAHVIYQITWDVPWNCGMWANIKGKFHIACLKSNFLEFETSQIEGKLTSLHISKKIYVFVLTCPLGNLFSNFEWIF